MELRLKLFIVSAGCVLSAFFLTLSVVEGPRTGNLQSSIVAFTPGTQLAQVVSAPSSGLVAYWNFDEGAGTSVTDSSGNGVNGNLVNSPTWAAGKIGSGALTFNGYASKALVTVPNPSNGLLDFGTGNFSYSFWMNPQNYVNQNGVNYIISKKGTVGWDFETIAGGIVREVITDGTHSQNKQFGTGAALSLNTWHHIVVVNARSDSSGPYIYIDGVKQVCSGNCSSDFTTVGNISSTAKLTFASRSSENPANYYAGSLDDVHIYNRALSAAEVSALYASTGSSGNSNNNLTDSNGTATSTASTTSTTDTTAPTLSGGTPSGSLSSSVTSATISVTSNEPATCKYSTTAGTAYANMESTFSVTGGTTHASSVSGLQSGQSYNYYARCEDGSGNSNTSDYTVSFSVASLTVPSIPAATDAESVTVLGSALSMTGQTGWNFYNGMDSLEGGYMGWMYAGTGSLSGTVRLPKALPSGHYNIFLKGIAYTNLSTTISASLGGGTTASQTLNNSDTNGYWTTSMPIDVQSSSDTLTVTISKGGSLSNIEKYLFRGIYITSDTNEIVTKDDVAVDLHYPTVMDKSTPIKGNIVDNAGFEVGYGADWGFYLNKNFDSTKIWSTESSHSGSASLKIPLDNTYNVYGSGTTLISRVYHLLPNKMYTASAWVRASSPVSGYIRLQNTFTPPAGYPSQYGVSSQTATIGTSWTRISVSGYMLAYPTSDYQIRLTIPSDSNGNTLYVDDVQLEEGDLSNFAPQHAVEAGLIINKPSALFYDNESALGTVKVHNYGATAATTKVNYAIYDYLNRQVSQNSVTVNAPVGSTADAQTNLSIGRRGIFRLVLWIDGSDNSDREYVYSVVPQPRSGDVQSSFMGIHTNYNDWQLSVLRKMGINWNLDMSPAEVVRWSTVEPSQNQFVWNDARVSIAAASGMQIVGTLGVVAPSWAGSGDSLNLSAWQNYVTQTVAHYKPWIHYWEVWNEPIYVFSPTFYAKMLKTASDAITASDPTAVIVGMGGDRSEWMQSVITSLESQYPDWDWKSHIAIFSAHAYPGGIVPSTYTTAIIGKYSEPVWNTEAGAKDLGFYKGNFSNFTA